MIPKGNTPSHYSNMAALIKAFLSIYGHCNDCCHMIQNCNDGEVLQRRYPKCKALSKLPEFTDEILKPKNGDDVIFLLYLVLVGSRS
jgi:hypothetical protein